MSIRENLKCEIDSFILKANDSFNKSRFNTNPDVNKSEFLRLEMCFFSLKKDDFESTEKYNYFLDYINQPRRQTESVEFKRLLQQDSIDGNHFSTLINYLLRIADHLK